MDTTVVDPLVGQLLDGRYQVQRRIARGGMATVYTALDTRLDRTVAVKVMHPGLADDEQFVARFIREAKSAARLSHPDVVSVFDQGEDGGRVFLVMEYVPGRTLRDVLNERGRLPPAEALALCEPILAALAAAHHAGLIHRDVKPENVLIGDDRIKVADFGLMRAIEASSLTATSGLLIGTAAYFAPEQVQSGTADARSDVYAAGILLFELLTGGPPYHGETPLAVAYQHVHGSIPPPSQSAPDVPAELDRLVLAATRRDPAGRPADAGVFLAQLRELRRELPPARPDLADTTSIRRGNGHHPTLIEPLPVPVAPQQPQQPQRTDQPVRRSRRRWGIIALAVVVLLGVLAGAAGWWFGSGRYVAVPDLRRMTETAATARAENAGLDVAVVATRHNPDVPNGEVLIQAPTPTDHIVRHGRIRLTLSLGPELFNVPKEIIGKTLDAATAVLTQEHLARAAAVTRNYSSQPPDTVLDSNPKPGTPERAGTSVTLIVSKGPPPVEVPDVRNKTSDDAANALGVKGLHAASSSTFSDTVGKGLVISQDPSGGQTLHQGDTVRIVVSKGPDLVAVPQVRGRSQQDAVALLEQAGLHADAQAFPGGPGRVLSQRPGDGQQVKRGSTVTLYVF